ncbi:MAG: sodium-dependent transporter [Ruminiclostridium sp.]|nr:sodium-dependent transporter [Ruminiclostridium sp.]
MAREKLGSRLGFILLSAGCAIGMGNVWKFPYMAGQYGGGAFVLIYLVFLVIMGLPVLTIEFSLGRAAQKSPVMLYQQLAPKGSKWHYHGKAAMIGNYVLMMFYTVVAGWMITYFVNTAKGTYTNMTPDEVGAAFGALTGDPLTMFIYTAIVIVLGFLVCSFSLQGGLERVTKVMMLALLAIMVILAIQSFTMDGAKEGLSFYLKPDLGKMQEIGIGNVIVGAMNQAFFTLSLGIGSMAIFGSYLDKKRSLMGESVNVVLLDTFVALTAGLIIFPACFTFDVEVGAGPSLIFVTLPNVFNNMAMGNFWGSLFFLFMVFAAMSTILAVFENILACVRELTGWNRPKGCVACGIGIFLLALTTALGYSVFSFQPFAPGSAWLDLWDFLVSTNLLPLGSLIFALFCCNKRYGWGWDKLVAEANTGKGLKVQQWMKPIFCYVVPVAIIVIYVMGLINFPWR